MRLAVIADVHANLLALDAVLADVGRHAPDLVLDLGDRASGPLWPAETLDRFEAHGIVGVRGNHDRAVGAAQGTKGLGRSDRFAWERLSPERRAGLGALPATLEPAPGVLAIHARPGRDDAYLLEAVRRGRQVRARAGKVARRLGPLPGVRLVLTGHSHRPDAVRLPSGLLVVNPGSVGLQAALDDDPPAHAIEAGAPHARYALVDLGPEIVVRHMAVPYDWEAAAARAEATGHASWARGLRTGWAR